VDLEHVFTVPMSVGDAWTAFNDLELIAPCFPGAVITSVDGDDFTGTAKIKLGPIALMYTGKGIWRERDEAARRVVIEANGKDKRGNGTAGATITARLEEDGPGTRVVVHTDLKITGRPAQFGRGVIQDVGTKILDQFADCLSTRLGGEAAGAPAAATPAGLAVVEEDITGEAETATTAETTLSDAATPAAGPSSDGEVAPQGPARVVPRAAGTPTAGGPAAGPPTAGGPTAGPSDAGGAAAWPADASVAPSPPAGQRGAAVPVSPPAASRTAPTGTVPELDLGNVMVPVLLRRFGPVVAACAVTAVVTWVIARRR
jgi:carbon monoxide dehydrogenase subunit G